MTSKGPPPCTMQHSHCKQGAQARSFQVLIHSNSSKVGVFSALRPKRPRYATRQQLVHVASVDVAPSKEDAGTRHGATSRHVAEAAEAGDTICWTSYWWPVQAIANLDPKIPVHVDLLGKSLVIWGDSQGNWHCLEDKCPHRLAPLSEGRVEKDNIMCCYHGWTFSGSGSCTSIPQLASDPKAHDNACSSKRSCVTSYPTRVENGLLWVWPEAGPEAAAKAATTEPIDMAFEGMTQWYVRDLPLRFDTLLENVTDPSHVPFTHHGVLGDRSKPSPIIEGAKTITHVDRNGTRLKGTVFGRDFNVVFCAPFRTIYYVNPQLPGNQVAVVPSRTGWSRIFYNVPQPHRSSSMRTLPLPVQWFLRIKMELVPALDHIITRNAVFDGDTYLLKQAEQFLPVSKGVGTVVTRAYHMPATDDGIIVALRKWFQQYGGDVPTCSPADEAAMPPLMNKEQANDRWNQHTKQCSHCLKALATLDKVQAVNVVVGLAAAVAAVAQAVAAAVLAHVPAAAVAATSSSSVSAASGFSLVSWWQACQAAGCQWQMIGCVVLAMASWALQMGTAKLRKKFFYEEYVHAHRD